MVCVQSTDNFTKQLPRIDGDICSYVSTHRYYEDTVKTSTDAFASYEAFLAFLRRHKRILVSNSLYLPRRGSAGSLVHLNIGLAVTKIIQAELGALPSDSQRASRIVKESKEEGGLNHGA